MLEHWTNEMLRGAPGAFQRAAREYAEEYAAAAVAEERERCAKECERLAGEDHAEMLKQPEGSPARDRYFARVRALRGAAVELRLGPNGPVNPTACQGGSGG